MKNLLLLTVTMSASLAFAEEAPKPVKPLQMLSPDKGVATYQDHCSNGANSTDMDTVRTFIQLMEKDPKSKLFQLEEKAKAETHAENLDFPRTYVWVSDVITASHIRSGCAGTYNKLVAAVQTEIGPYNGHDGQTRYLIIIEDTVKGATRTLEFKESQALKIKSED